MTTRIYCESLTLLSATLISTRNVDINFPVLLTAKSRTMLLPTEGPVASSSYGNNLTVRHKRMYKYKC